VPRSARTDKEMWNADGRKCNLPNVRRIGQQSLTLHESILNRVTVNILICLLPTVVDTGFLASDFHVAGDCIFQQLLMMNASGGLRVSSPKISDSKSLPSISREAAFH